MKLIDKLFEGPLDIIGDVHGEIEGLEQLVHKLGYDADGNHPDGRRLVFVGDLIDRGPDSPAVLQWVSRLVAAGKAQCILGNHEINLLHGVLRDGNAWYIDPEAESRYPAKRVDPRQKAEIRRFLSTLPLALERDDLRVVHACWHPESIAKLRSHESEGLPVIAIFRRYDSELERRWEETALRKRAAEAAAHAHALTDPHWADPQILPAHAAIDAAQQMSNPVRVVTSGTEGPTPKPFWAAGKWRMVERLKWWEAYAEATPVIVGHYWRRLHESQTLLGEKNDPDLFEGIEPHHWMGKRANVYCVDFSVGGRPRERISSTTPPFLCKLSALRVPEWEVVHDDGAAGWPIGQPGNVSAETLD